MDKYKGNQWLIDEAYDLGLEDITSFPCWAPQEVIDLYTKEDSPIYKYVLGKILTDEGMRCVWEKLQAFDKPLNWASDTTVCEVFALKTRLAFGVQEPFSTLTDADAKEYRERVEKLARELANLVSMSNQLNELIIRDYQGRKLQAMIKAASNLFISNDQPKITQPISAPKMLSEYLLEMADSVQDVEKKNDLKKPNDAKARRKIFAQDLTVFFRENFNRPHREIVRDTAAVLFNDPALDERIISRLAP